MTVNISTMEPLLCEPANERVEITEFSDNKKVYLKIYRVNEMIIHMCKIFFLRII